MSVWQEAWKLVPGSAGLLVGRMTVVLLSGVPAGFAIESRLRQTLGRGTETLLTADPLPFPVLLRALREVGTWGAALTAGCVLVAFVLDQLLASAAVARFDSSATRGASLLADIGTRGMVNLLPLLRLALGVAVLGGLGAAGISTLFDMWVLRAEAAGDTLFYSQVVLNVARAAAITLWFTALATTTFWARTVMLMDARRRVGRLLLILPRILWRAKRGWLAVGVMLLGLQLSGAALLWAVRPGFADLGSLGLWWLWVLASVYFWHAAFRLTVATYRQELFHDLRQKSDDPWPVWDVLKRLRRTLSSARWTRTVLKPAGDSRHHRS